MKKLIMMMGIPGAGKSTWAKKFVASQPEGEVIYISRDEIRNSFVKPGAENYFSKENSVYGTFVKKIKDGLAENKTVIADATHINEASRSKLLRALGISLKDCTVEIVYLHVHTQKALIQNENRIHTRGYVPRGVIRRMSNQITEPTFEEGFNIIRIINEDGTEVLKVPEEN